MNRRNIIGSLVAGLVALLTCRNSATAATTSIAIPGSIKLILDERIRIDASSKPIEMRKDTPLEIITIGTGRFSLDEKSRLTAVLSCGVTQYNDIEYWISVAVFDEAGRLLGSACHKESVQYVRAGLMPCMFREIELDFGISEAYKNATQIVVAISDRKVAIRV